MARTIIEAYERAAPTLLPRYAALNSTDMLRKVSPWLPVAPAKVLDIGAGTGRDAAWLAARGHRVTAIEPVAAFRAAAARMHGGRGLRLLAGSLPRLPGLGKQRFDLLLLSALWHHLDRAERSSALRAMRRLMQPGGRVIMSLREGPTPPERPGHPLLLRECFASARSARFGILKSIPVEAQQEVNRRAGVRWTWLVLEAV